MRKTIVLILISFLLYTGNLFAQGKFNENDFVWDVTKNNESQIPIWRREAKSILYAMQLQIETHGVEKFVELLMRTDSKRLQYGPGSELYLVVFKDVCNIVLHSGSPDTYNGSTICGFENTIEFVQALRRAYDKKDGTKTQINWKMGNYRPMPSGLIVYVMYNNEAIILKYGKYLISIHYLDKVELGVKKKDFNPRNRKKLQYA